MMKIKLLAIFSILTSFSFGQMVVPQQIRAENNLDRIDTRGLSTGDFILGIPPETGKPAGAGYLDEQWHIASINLYEGGKVLNGYPIKYNLKEQILEVNTRLGIRITSIQKIKSFSWYDSTARKSRAFVNAKDYHTDNGPMNGFLEVLVKGCITLFRHISVTVKEANYVPALAMGSMDEKLIRQVTFYYTMDSTLIKVKNQKLLLNAFAGHQQEMTSFIKSNRLDIKNEEDLIKVINEYNGMVGKPVR